MIIYFIISVCFFLLSFSCFNVNYSSIYSHLDSHSRIRKIAFCCFVLFIIVGLRGPQIGSDTPAYFYEYNAVVSNIEGYKEVREPGYLLLEYIFSRFSIPWQLFLVFISAFMAFSLGYYIYKNCINIFLAFFLHMTIGLFLMTLTGIRQSIAISITILVLDKKNWKYFLGVLVASSFHYSAFIMFPAYCMNFIKYKNKEQLILFLMLPPFVRIMSPVFTRMMTLIDLGKYEYYRDSIITINPLNEVFYWGILFVVTILLVTYDNNMSDRDFYNFLGTVISSCIIELSTIEYMFIRVQFYFMIHYVVLIPNLIQRITEKKYRLLGYWVLFAISIIFLYLNIDGNSMNVEKYLFFWQ